MKRIVVLIALVVSLSVAPVGVAVADDHGASAGNSSAESSAADYSLDELKQRGPRIEGGSPADRYLGDYGSAYLAYQETNFIKKLGDTSPKWSVDKVVTQDKTVDTRKVTMRVSRARNAPTEEIRVHVVKWERGTKTVQDGNVTREKTIATNVSEKVITTQLEGSADRVTIRLPDTEAKQRLTIWIEGYPDARWADIPYEPVALSDSLPFGASWGSFLPWFITRFGLITGIGVPIAISAGVKTIEKYGTGTGKGALWWLFVLGLGSYFTGYFALGKVAELIVALPWVFGVGVVGIAYVATIEYVGEADTYLFEQILTETTTNPIGEEVPDIAGEKGEKVDVVDIEGTDDVGLVNSGSLRSFAALVAGADMPTIAENDLETRVPYSGAGIDGKFYVDEPDREDPSQPDELLEISWPTLSFGLENLKEGKPDMPEDVEVDEENETGLANRTKGYGEGLGTAIFVFGISAAVGAQALGSTSLGLLVGFVPLGFMMTEVENGRVNWVEAPVHSTSAKAQRITELHEHNIAKTFKEVTENLAEDDTEVVDMAIEMTESYINNQRQKLDRLMMGGSGGAARADHGGAGAGVDDVVDGRTDKPRGVGDD